MVGGFNTLFGYSVFAIAVMLLSGSIHYIFILLGAYGVAMAAAYTLHRKFVFRVTGRGVRDFPRFAAIHVWAILLNIGLLPLFVEVIGIHVLVAQWLVVIIVASGTYLGHKYFTFRRHGPG